MRDLSATGFDQDPYAWHDPWDVLAWRQMPNPENRLFKWDSRPDFADRNAALNSGLVNESALNALGELSRHHPGLPAMWLHLGYTRLRDYPLSEQPAIVERVRKELER